MVVPHYCKQVFIFYLEMLELRFLAYDTVPTIMRIFYFYQYLRLIFNPLSANLIKWSNTFKQFVGCC